jgi:hypothetical protein
VTLVEEDQMAFEDSERSLPLSSRGMGPLVVQRLEQVGIDSLAKLREAGVEAASDAVCDMLGSVAWGNRRRALVDAFASLNPSNGRGF